MDIDFKKSSDGLVPAIIQDSVTGKVLMLGYMNQESYTSTRKTGKVTFYSRSRKCLWTKGETSGNFLKVVTITPDCDNDTLLIKAVPAGPICHTGSDTCFDEENDPTEFASAEFLSYLEGVIVGRRDFPTEGSYTNHLFTKGIHKIAQKVGEEAVELVIEAMDNNKQLFLGEAADLLYHFLVLLAHKGYTLDEVVEVLKNRHSR